uniref:Uncharacterized protein n=1 Tax=Megaselia scalaris TaxID=36166 RepID=T1GJF9_MEGSC
MENTVQPRTVSAIWPTMYRGEQGGVVNEVLATQSSYDDCLVFGGQVFVLSSIACAKNNIVQFYNIVKFTAKTRFMRSFTGSGEVWMSNEEVKDTSEADVYSTIICAHVPDKRIMISQGNLLERLDLIILHDSTFDMKLVIGNHTW